MFAEIIARASVKLPQGASLLERAPHVAAKWHPWRNGSVLPRAVHAGSPNKAWWACDHDHEWVATIRDLVRKGTGCPFCSGKRATITNCIGAVQQAAKRWHPTKNLPDTPWEVTPQSNRKFWWVCNEGHEWFASANNVVGRGSGCPRCVDARDSKRERECRDSIEQLTGHQFPKSKPDWLRSNRGFQLELDGFSEKLRLAFEHHGIQHYQYVPFFHSGQRFKRTQELDVEKRSRCVDAGITLIEVRWDCVDIKSFLRDQLRRCSSVGYSL